MKVPQASVKAVERKLYASLRKSKYEKLRFREPQIGEDVIVEFSIQDANEERGEYDSKQKLKKAIQKALSETNWGLMSDE